MEITLETLGLTKEDVAERVVERVVERLLDENYLGGEDDEPDQRPSQFGRQIEARIHERISQAIDNIAGQYTMPAIEDYLSNFRLQQTNTWGEPKQPPISFVEYLVQRADGYMQEEVDSDGRSRAEYQRRGNTFYGKGNPRATWMVEKYLASAMQQQMTKAMAELNQRVADGLAATVKQQLAEVLAKLKVNVATK